MTNSGSSALLGSQEPRVKSIPRAAYTDHAEGAEILCSGYGLDPFPWQRLCLEAFLGTRKDGKWSASRCGLAVPRQNGKNGVLEMIELYLMVELGYKILHTAHEVKTARKAFLRLASFFENERQHPELAALCREIRRTNGQEAISLTNGASIEFIARSKGSGRGFTVDMIVLDESQELSEEAMAALRPTIAAAPQGDPKIIFTGTPPAPNMDGAYWTRIRTAGVGGKDRRLAYLEWSPEDGADLDDIETVKATNPSFGVLLNPEVVKDERADMDDVTYARERTGMWDSEKDLRVIASDVWESRATLEPTTVGPIAFGVDASPNLDYVSIVAARKGADETHVEVVEQGSARAGTQWIVDWLAKPERRRRPVVVDEWSPAAFLIPDLEAAGIKVTKSNTQMLTTWCAQFVNAAVEGSLTHFDQVQLNRAVAGASKRNIRDGQWAWNRKQHDINITPLVAATLAFGHVQNVKTAAARPRRIY